MVHQHLSFQVSSVFAICPYLALLLCGWLTATAWAAPAEQRATDTLDLASRRAEHWAWRENSAVKPPTVNDANWCRNDIDPFIFAKLEATGLEPAARADKRTLIRRAYLDVIGLPPTPEQVAAFVADSSDNAFERVVDELLKSPRYGERWGRHWLDLVRYAESMGHEFDGPIEHAWKYRDYVIRALNADVPHDQFVREHVAGDLLAEQRMHPTEKYEESILGTGWWFLYEQTHAPTDVRQHESDRIDNQIDVLTKTFLGLTVGCARCHDHKFDAISAADFYALSGYLQSSRRQEAYLDPGRRIAAGIERLQTLRTQATVAMAAANVAKPEAETAAQEVEAGAVLFEDFSSGTLAERGWLTTGWAWSNGVTGCGENAEWDRMSGRASWVKPGVAHSGQLGPQLMGTLWSPEFDVTHRQIAMRVCGKGTVRLIIDGFRLAGLNGLLFNGTLIDIDTKGKWQWVRIGGDTYLYSGTGEHRAHLEFVDDDREAYLAVDEIRFTERGLEDEGDTEAFLPSATPPTDTALAEIARRMDEVAKDIPAPMRALAMVDGTAENSPVYVRGSWKIEGDVVPRRFLTAIAGEDQPTLTPADGSGRLKLVRQMLGVGAPLVSRTMVNRIWHHLMRRGIAPTVDNFGVLGEPPTHPELLDWLSAKFRRDGWSVKRMIKRILMSSTYQMSSKPTNTLAEKQDPTNALLHRMRVKRLEGEAIRDVVLALSGRLDERMYGEPIPIHLTEFMEGRGRARLESGPLDGDGRRSIYISVRRNFLSPMMLAFDTPQPFNTVGRRTVSNVPAQALIMMNDPLIVQQASVWARKLIAAQPDPAERIERMHLEAYGRPVEADELQRMLAFVERQGESHGVAVDKRAGYEPIWADLAHVLLNVKEFILVP